MNIIKRLFRFIFKIIFWLVAFSIGMAFLYKYVPVKVTPLMVVRYFEPQEQSLRVLWEHDWVSLDHISKNLQLAVICSEDQIFLNHNGFDFKAIEKAFEYNKKGKRIKGASTISQQTAKNVFLWSQRSWFRKGLETYFTFLIELCWSKERIMEVYLNSIEMGKGVFGAEAASKHWFKKSTRNLSKLEASSIAAILPNPRSNYIQGRTDWIIKQMVYFGVLDYPEKDEKKVRN